MSAICGICPHNCRIEEGQTGLCKGRSCKDGRVVCSNYGRLTSVALDPIEKKPLQRFLPGSVILSAGSYGCNLKCPFCQNSDISQADEKHAVYDTVTAKALSDMAKGLTHLGNIGVAYTYNEPLISYEFVKDCSVLVKEWGGKNVLVTNGYVNEAPLKALLPLTDAMNIDLKGFSNEFYKGLFGDLETVKRTIILSASCCHVEITTLIIPGENDKEEEMEAEAAWLAAINKEIPLHISRFFPRYLYSRRESTPVETVKRLSEIAGKHLKYVYTGNC